MNPRAVFLTVALLLCSGRVLATDLAWLDDQAALQNFVAGIVAGQIAEQQVVGATVAVVRGGEVRLARGYGLADREQAQAVVAQDTLFHIGSVSKLFVWVAVMQQVAAGRLDLDADVNEYLTGFELPATYPEPITLRHLMTHTAGFEDKILGLFAHGPRTMGDFHENLAAMLPQRVMMPGRYVAYSNYGAALAAYIVELVSGEDWDSYVERHILAPLGMSSTTSRQPAPEALARRVAKSYWWADGDYVSAPAEFVTLPPAGSFSATGSDMARFMLELLRLDDSQVLTSAARAQLFAAGFSQDARLNGMLHGLYEQNSHGHKLMGHGGDTLSFHSQLLLCPELDLGVFVSYNNDRGAATTTFTRAFLDRLFGAQDLRHQAFGVMAAERYAGYYASLRAPASGHDRILSLLGMVRVSANPAGELVVSTLGGARRFVPLGDDLFVESNGSERLAFEVEGARATHFFIDSMPMLSFERVPSRDNPILQLTWIAAVLALSVGVWLLWPLSWLRHRGRVGQRGETVATLLAVSNATLILAYVYMIAGSFHDLRELIFGLPPTLQQALWIPVLLTATLLLQLLYGVRAWVNGWWWPARRIHYTLLGVGGIGFVVWAFYWHLTALIINL